MKKEGGEGAVLTLPLPIAKRGGESRGRQRAGGGVFASAARLASMVTSDPAPR